MDLYRYGWVAWLWRAFAGAGVLAGLGLMVLAWRQGAWSLAAIGGVLALPGIVLGPMVAVRIRRLDSSHIEVRTLAFWQRRIAIAHLGPARLRTHAQGTVQAVHAPRLWVPVQGGLPIHIDLLGQIPDREAFRALLSLPAAWVPRGDSG
ncbi:hypothetical protein [Arenimonas sp. MALMAid1274]|uniref:hypothetical protein n=1 Tax=Arenimonas sp. MALMAid1274 TaxID=3411630 RepID=UPI003B9F3ED6